MNAYERAKEKLEGSMEERGVYRLNTLLLCMAGKKLDPEIWRMWKTFKVC